VKVIALHSAAYRRGEVPILTPSPRLTFEPRPQVLVPAPPSTSNELAACRRT
jgi:hypothetical protein